MNQTDTSFEDQKPIQNLLTNLRTIKSNQSSEEKKKAFSRARSQMLTARKSKQSFI